MRNLLVFSGNETKRPACLLAGCEGLRKNQFHRATYEGAATWHFCRLMLCSGWPSSRV